VIDSVEIRKDSAMVHLTLRDREHVHREVYDLARRDDLWYVVTVRMDRILRLHEARRRPPRTRIR
jgi:hypothetical protein